MVFHVLYHCVIPETFIQNTLSLDKCVPHEEHVMAACSTMVCKSSVGILETSDLDPADISSETLTSNSEM